MVDSSGFYSPLDSHLFMGLLQIQVSILFLVVLLLRYSFLYIFMDKFYWE